MQCDVCCDAVCCAMCCVRRRGAALFGSMAFRQHIHSRIHSLITRLLAGSYPALAEGFVCGVYDDIIVYVCVSCYIYLLKYTATYTQVAPHMHHFILHI